MATLTTNIRGPAGQPGADSTVPGPPGPAGPTAVSADAGNTAVLGSDQLVYVPAVTRRKWSEL